jgi:hypothetical protein
MRNQIDIDVALSRAIIREIGEGLRASLGDDELPARLRAQLEMINQLDGQSLPPIVPGPQHERIEKTIGEHRRLIAPMRWTTRWRARFRRSLNRAWP